MFQLPDLPYDYDALEPYVDRKTMHIHHTKHHQGYTDKLNAAIEDTDLEEKTIEEILSSVSDHKEAVRNNGGGYYNHKLFWEAMSPEGGGNPTGAVAEKIIQNFGSFDQFKEAFEAAATGQFGSGWGWLVVNDGGELVVGSTPNQDNPLMDVTDLSGTPLLGLDVWEHAYYLKYQNRRGEYAKAFWNVVNWDVVNERLAAV